MLSIHTGRQKETSRELPPRSYPDQSSMSHESGPAVPTVLQIKFLSTSHWSDCICRQQNPLSQDFKNWGMSKMWTVLRESFAGFLFPMYTFLKLIYLSLVCHAGFPFLPSFSKLTFNCFAKENESISSMYDAFTQD